MEISYHECDREAWACSLPSCTTAISPELCWCFFFSGWVKICVRFTVESFVGFTSLLIKRNSDAWKKKKKHIKNRQSRLQGPHGLNYQHYHFHHILGVTLLLYQQLDLSAVLQTTISAFWHTIKRCHTRLLRRCVGSCCQLIKHYLKEVFLAKGSSQPGSLTDSEEGAW